MREIEFRAKHTWDGSFKYGYLVHIPADNSYRITQGRETSYFVDPETVGQYTEMKDKNGTKIFTDDIVKFNNQIFLVVYAKGAFGLGCIDIINYNKLEKEVFKKNNNAYLGCYNDNFISLFEILWNFDNCVDDIEVIGNIYDNPELLN